MIGVIKIAALNWQISDESRFLEAWLTFLGGFGILIVVSLSRIWRFVRIELHRPFVDMNKLFNMTPLRDKLPLAVLTFSIFATAGILHEFTNLFLGNFSRSISDFVLSVLFPIIINGALK